jgi:hypothetical protein
MGEGIQRQADSGARDIGNAMTAGYGYLGGVGNQGFGAIGGALQGGYGGLNAQGNAMSGIERDTFSGIGGLASSISGSPVLGSLNANYGASLGALGNMYSQSRNDPSAMLRQSQDGLSALNAQTLGAIGSGMDQYYGNAANNNLSLDPYRNQLADSWRDFGGAYGTSNGNIQNMWNTSLGHLPMFQTPAEQGRRKREADVLGRQYRAEDEAFSTAQAGQAWRNAGRPEMEAPANKKAQQIMADFQKNKQFLQPRSYM